MTDQTMQETRYVTYIATTPQQCWQALTSADYTSRYFFGRRIEGEWKVGAAWTMHKPDGQIDVHGQVRECDPPRKLVLSWIVAWAPDIPECLVRYEIEAVGEHAVRLTMTEAHPTSIAEALLEGGRRGWPMILSGLKTLLETGKPLVLPLPQPPKEMQK